MLLPNLQVKKSSSEAGQVIIIFLLVLVVGLAVVLSIASRTVIDIRQTTTSDESNRAYFAAEAGVQEALKKITETPTFNTSSGPDQLNFTDVNKSSTTVSVETLYKDTDASAGKIFEFPSKIGKDDSAQLYLLSNYSDIATAGTGSSIQQGDTLNFYWDDSSSGTGPALELTVLTCDTNPCSATSNINLSKMVFDVYASSRISTSGPPVSSTNNFCSDTSVVNTGTFSKSTNMRSNVNYRYKLTLDLDAPTPARCNNDTLAAGVKNPLLIRIKPLYASAPVSIAVESVSAAGRFIPNQGQKIVSIGKTPSGVTRKLTVTKLYPSLPTAFDWVLFNGGSGCLTKSGASC